MAHRNRIAAEVGGKSLTTPQRIVDGIGHATAKADSHFADSALFLHGSTIAINVMLERTLAHARAHGFITDLEADRFGNSGSGSD